MKQAVAEPEAKESATAPPPPSQWNPPAEEDAAGLGRRRGPGPAAGVRRSIHHLVCTS